MKVRKLSKKKEKKTRAVFIVIIVVLVIALVAAAGMGMIRTSGAEGGGRTGPAGEVEEEVVFAVNTTSAVLGPIADYFDINGEVVTASSVDTYADASGILARLYVGLGDYVRRNQVIAEVDPTQPGLKYTLSPVKARVSGTITSLPLDQGRCREAGNHLHCHHR